MIRHALREAIERMERIARIGTGHDPPVMALVQVLVYSRVVQPSMDPVDEEIGEEEEEERLGNVVPDAWAV